MGKLATSPVPYRGAPPLQSGGQNQKWPTSGQIGYLTRAVSGSPTASERGAKSEVAHKWANWLPHPCRIGEPHRLRAGGKIRSGAQKRAAGGGRHGPRSAGGKRPLGAVLNKKKKSRPLRTALPPPVYCFCLCCPKGFFVVLHGTLHVVFLFFFVVSVAQHPNKRSTDMATKNKRTCVGWGLIFICAHEGHDSMCPSGQGPIQHERH